MLGHGIFTQEGPAWKHSRELLRKQFVRTQYQKPENFREHVDNLLAHLPVTKGVVDLQPLFFKFTLDTTTALLLGQAVRSLKAELNDDSEIKAFAENFNIVQGGLAKRFRLAPLHSLYNPPSFKRACSAVHRIVDSYIQERAPRKTKNVKAKLSETFPDQIAEESRSHEMLRHQLLNILLAGRDTTACCLSWTMRLLVRHTAVMERLRREIASVLGESEHPSREQIKKMPYLALVIKECMTSRPV